MHHLVRQVKQVHIRTMVTTKYNRITIATQVVKIGKAMKKTMMMRNMSLEIKKNWSLKKVTMTWIVSKVVVKVQKQVTV